MADKPLDLSGVPNLNKMLKEAERLGCTVAKVPNTGEVRVSHPDYPKRLTLNARKKSGNQAITQMLRQLQGNAQRTA